MKKRFLTINTLPQEINQYSQKELDYFHDVFETNLKERKILINEGVDSKTWEKVGHAILQFNKEDKGLSPDERKPILLYINCIGGEVDTGFNLINIIQNSKTPVWGIALGKAYSMGFLMFLVCHKRIAFEYSSFLIHKGENFLEREIKKCPLIKRFYFDTENIVHNMILDYSDISPKMYAAFYEKEWYFYTKTAVKLKIVDYVIGRNIDLDDIL